MARYNEPQDGARIRTSDSGAIDIGPKANPRTYRLNPRVPTSLETPKSFSNLAVAGLYPEAPQDTDRSTSVIAPTTVHFFHVGQFLGFSVGFKVIISTFECSRELRVCKCWSIMSAEMFRLTRNTEHEAMLAALHVDK
jgi:hypothetical protein